MPRIKKIFNSLDSETPTPKEINDEDGKRLYSDFSSPSSSRSKKEMSNATFSRAEFSALFIDEVKARNISSLYFISNNFYEIYEELGVLGKGCSGLVKRCRCVQTGKEFAVKITNTKSDEESMILHLNEFSRRKTLSHKNIITVHEIYIDCVKHKIYTVMELAHGVELQKLIETNGSLNETKAAKIFKQIALAIQYLHKNGVCHRDLKPENILVSQDNYTVKIIDFNVSKFNDLGSNSYSALSKANYKMWTYTGTVSFMAPEIFKELEYTEMVDSWSTGVILYTMLVGYHPFQADLKADLIDKIVNSPYEMKGEAWNSISDEAKDLVQNLLQKVPEDRYTPFQILAHPWILNNGKCMRNTKKLKNKRQNSCGEQEKQISGCPKLIRIDT